LTAKACREMTAATISQTASFLFNPSNLMHNSQHKKSLKIASKTNKKDSAKKEFYRKMLNLSHKIKNRNIWQSLL